MPNYLVTSPDGKKFKITAPEGATQDQVLSYAKAHWGSLGGNQPSAPAPAQKPGILPSIGASAGAGFGKSALGVQQLLGKALSTSTQPSVSSAGNWLQQNAESGIAQLQQQEAPYQAAHPFATGAGGIGGEAVAALAPGGLLSKAAPAAELLTPAATWLGRAGQAAGTGLVSGAEQYVSGPDYWKQKAEETASNVAGSVAGSQFFEGLGGIGRFMSKYNPGAAKYHAVQKISSRIAQDEKGGHPSAKDVIDLIHTSHAAGVPLTLMEAGGENVRGLAGHVARAKGASRSIIFKSYADRLKDAATRLTASVRKNFDAPETRRAVQKSLTESQQAASFPAYAKAFKPGSIAPLKTQFEKTFNDISRARKQAQLELNQAKVALTLATAKVSRAGNDVNSNSSALRELRSAQANAEEIHGKIQNLEQDHGNVVTQLRAAQQAEANGERGGVWSPHISRMMKNPRIQEGIRRGISIQRDEADAQNIPFDPTEYAVKYDTKGDPIIFKTPNMRLLDSAKKGIDSMLEEYRNPITGKLELNEEGRAINQLRAAWINELDRINGDYKAARDAYAGPAASKAAMLQGENIMNTHPEDVKDIFDNMHPSEQEHYRIGAAQAYLNKISDDSINSTELRKISREDNESTARSRLQPIFKTKSKLDDFITSVTGERSILNSMKSIIGNSATQARNVEDTAHDLQPYLDAIQGAKHAINLNIPQSLSSAMRVLKHLDLIKNTRVNEEIAKILSDPKIKFSQTPGEVLPMPTPPPPGKFTSSALAASPIGQALGARAGGSFQSDI